MNAQLLLRTLVPVALIALALPAAASGQATRTWVSGVGDDSFPCSRTAPCKTWAGAISKTAEGGEIDALDPGGFGSITITKSITLDGAKTHASNLVCGAANANAVTVNADPTDKVILRDLSLFGCKNTTGLPATAGVQVHKVGSLRVEDSRIFNFQQAGIRFEPTNLNARLIVEDTRIHDNTNYGVFARPKTGGSGRVTLNDTRIDDNGNGLVASSLYAPINTRLFGSSIFDSGQDGGTGYGVWATGNSSAVRIGDSRIVGNKEGIKTTNGSLISYGGNIVDDNDVDGNFTSNVARK